MNLEQYELEGCKNIDEHPCFSKEETYPEFQKDFEIFKNQLIEQVNNKQSKTYYKFGDGDYFFLKQIPHGSANPGKRALSKSYDSINIERFIAGVPQNDYWMVELYPENRAKFKELYPNLPIQFPAEYCYASVTSRWITKTFNGKIGVLGGKEKISLIKKLMQHKEYQEFLGLEKFNDYIEIPEKFACDDIQATIDMVAEQMKNAKSDIFILGVGHTKNGLLHELPKIHPAVYLDVGTGINAIAGIVSLYRPYCGDWKNYMLPDFWDYEGIDMMDYHDTEGQNRIYLK
jgi:hypothetical protein